mmetsp:Transcript_36636/g.76267  ORF Transcript_36636/g.76267 Transcript_36636/m.76267 type:complete len:84 (+) Transcript_36636:583-834(+)
MTVKNVWRQVYLSATVMHMILSCPFPMKSTYFLTIKAIGETCSHSINNVYFGNNNVPPFQVKLLQANEDDWCHWTCVPSSDNL